LSHAAQLLLPGSNAEEAKESLRFSAPDDVPTMVNTQLFSPEFEKPDARSPVNEFYLGKLVELARLHDIKLSYLVMPFNRDVSHPEPEYFQTFADILKHAGFAHCASPPLWWPNDLFMDSNHLNALGVEEFNSKLLSGIEYCR
jgi:hypothetical protein